MARKMKDSGIAWIGDIPEHWDVFPVLYAFSESVNKNADGKVTNALKFFNGAIIRKTNFDADTDEYVAETIANYTLVVPNTIMINGLNLNYDLKSLRVGIVKEVGVITSAYMALTPNEQIIPQYATYLFKGYETRMAFHNMGTGIRKTLGFKEFKRQPILVPPLTEQRRIASFLDARCALIDAAIDKTRASIEEYKKLKQAIITEAVTKGVRGTKRRMKDSGIEWIGEIPEEWGLVKVLRGLAMPITDGPHTTPDLYDNGIAFVSAEAVSCGNGEIDFNHIRGYISEEFYFECCKKYTPAIDDVYMIKSGATTGRVAIVTTLEPKFTIWSPLAVFRCNTNVMLSKYLYYQLQSSWFQKQIELSWTYGTQQNIGMRVLEQLKVTFPPLSEQKEIALFINDKLKSVDRIIENKSKEISDLELYKKSLIYEYVTGKKEVPA